jgi:hypothetical protein
MFASQMTVLDDIRHTFLMISQTFGWISEVMSSLICHKSEPDIAVLATAGIY